MAFVVPRPHILTIALEDYFQVGAFNRFVQRDQWYRFESRLEQNTLQTLALLDRYQARATFFVLGWVAKRFPQLVRAVADRGHEVATKGYYHRGVKGLTPEEFRADCDRAKAVVEAASGRPVVGYRLADGWLMPEDLWALDVLTEAGFAYDSSIAPRGRIFGNQPGRRSIHLHESGGGQLWEVPISTGRILGMTTPVAGGNYIRQFPTWVTRRAVAKWEAADRGPLVAYFHVWELDPEQPRLAVGGRLTQLRHYRNLGRMPARLSALLGRRPFTSIADYLNLQPGQSSGEAVRLTDTPMPMAYWASDTGELAAPSNAGGPPTPLTVVVPCFNEEDSLTYLANTLAKLRAALADRYEVRYVIVDDGSSDQTWAGLQAHFASRPATVLVQHERNQGVAAAIMTGILRSETELVASIDCDCTYDPLELARMVPKLLPGVDLVTASPYHPAGQVRNVPRWRLTLSKGAAWLYRRTLRTQLHTYTACFRVYRRSSVAGIVLKHGGFLGVAELVGRLDLCGGTIVEHPATLEVRMLGRSKMKTVRTIFGHLGLLRTLARARLTGRWGRAHRNSVIKSVVESHAAAAPVLIRRHAVVPPPADPSDVDVRRVVVNPPGTP